MTGWDMVCCDLTDSEFIDRVAKAHQKLAEVVKIAGKQLPRNRDLPYDKHKDRLLRDLDCATIEFVHEQQEIDYSEDIKRIGFSNLKIFDSTRGIFTEGGPAFPGSDIMAKTHTQLCVRNFNCIQGFFLPRREKVFMPWAGSTEPLTAA